MARVDFEGLRLALVDRLPVRVRWMIHGTPLDLDFTRARLALRRLEATEVVGGPIEETWRSLLLFGEQDYAEGGGARVLFGVHEESGEVCGLDIERTDAPMFFLNSDVDAFIATFGVFDAALRLGTLNASQLAYEAERLDPGFLRSDWRTLADHLRSGTQ